MSEPRAYTEDEVVEMLLQHIKVSARYWAELPEIDPATGNRHTTLDRCEGVAFSILSTLDGSSMNLPAFDLKLAPHKDDEQFRRSEGENWFAPGMEISVALHELFCAAERKPNE